MAVTIPDSVGFTVNYIIFAILLTCYKDWDFWKNYSNSKVSKSELLKKIGYAVFSPVIFLPLLFWKTLNYDSKIISLNEQISEEEKKSEEEIMDERKKRREKAVRIRKEYTLFKNAAGESALLSHKEEVKRAILKNEEKKPMIQRAQTAAGNEAHEWQELRKSAKEEARYYAEKLQKAEKDENEANECQKLQKNAEKESRYYAEKQQKAEKEAKALEEILREDEKERAKKEKAKKAENRAKNPYSYSASRSGCHYNSKSSSHSGYKVGQMDAFERELYREIGLSDDVLGDYDDTDSGSSHDYERDYDRSFENDLDSFEKNYGSFNTYGGYRDFHFDGLGGSGGFDSFDSSDSFGDSGGFDSFDSSDSFGDYGDSGDSGGSDW